MFTTYIRRGNKDFAVMVVLEFNDSGVYTQQAGTEQRDHSPVGILPRFRWVLLDPPPLTIVITVGRPHTSPVVVLLLSCIADYQPLLTTIIDHNYQAS